MPFSLLLARALLSLRPRPVCEGGRHRCGPVNLPQTGSGAWRICFGPLHQGVHQKPGRGLESHRARVWMARPKREIGQAFDLKVPARVKLARK